MEKRLVVSSTSEWLDQNPNVLADLDRIGRRPRFLVLAHLIVNIYRTDLIQIDTQIQKRGLHERHHLIRQEVLIEFSSSEESTSVIVFDLCDRHAEDIKGSSIRKLPIHILCTMQKTLHRFFELVEIQIATRPLELL